MYCLGEESAPIYLKPGFQRWEISFRILWVWQHGWTLLEQHLFHRIGRYTIGPIGWCGVLQLPFLSGRSVKAEPSKKRFWEVMPGDFWELFLRSLFWEIMDWHSR